MGKKAKRARQRNAVGSGGSGAATPKKFTASTSGLEDVYFTWGTAKDTAKFEDTVSQLARHVGTQPWRLSSVASKAMSAIEASVITSPARPSRKYWTNETWLVETNDKTSGTGTLSDPVVGLIPVKEEWDHLLDVDDFKIERRAFQEREAAWKENRAKCYYLVLSHCPKELEQELRNSTKWAATEAD